MVEFILKLFSRLLPTIPDGVTEELQIDLNLYRYLSVVSQGVIRVGQPVTYTKNFQKLKEAITQRNRVHIIGPKGCGKTFLSIVMYAILHKENLDCLYLNANSFKFHNACIDYFTDFLLKHSNNCGFTEEIKRLLHTEKDFARGVGKLVFEFTKKELLYLFVDVSYFKSESFVSLENVLNLVLECGIMGSKAILSVSSGARGVDSTNVKLNNTFANILKNSFPVEITGFTESEAEQYVSMRNCSLTYTEIKDISGTNPYLLSYVGVTDDYGQYNGTVKHLVHTFLTNNLAELKGKSDSLAEYLKSRDVLKSRKFAYYACRGDALDDDEVTEYKSTWLHMNYLTVLKVVPEVKTEVLEDQPDETNAESEEKEQVEGDTGPTNTILRWNFPTMGKVFLDIITDFVTTSSKELVEDVCKKEPSFAGFWFEALFFHHHKQTSASLTVEYVFKNTDGTNKQMKQVKFFIASMMTLDSITSKFDPKSLYELRRQHPIVDSVGYLQDEFNRFWLVFIQVSLQAYKDHRKMCDLFHKPPSRKNTPRELINKRNMSLYSYYRRLCGIQYQENANIMLLYVSPMEINNVDPTNVLPSLQESINKLKKVKQEIHVAILSKHSTFYSEHKEKFFS